MKKRIWIPVLLIILGVGGYFGYRQVTTAQAARQTTYQTETAARGDLTATVGATGTVRSNQSAILVWQTTGNIQHVDVKLDQPVKAGERLAVLDPLTLSQAIILAESDLVAAQKELRDLEDPTLAQAETQQTLAEAQKTYDEAKRKRDNLGRGRASKASIDSAYANYILAQDKVETLEHNYNNLRDRSEDDPIRALALANLSNAEKERDKALANLNWYKGTPSQQEIADADAALAVATAKLADAQAEWNRLKNGPDPDDIRAAKARIAAIEATLSLAWLTAPFDGVVTDIMIKPGDIVSPQTEAFRVDDLSHLLIDVPVTEVDVNRIQVGQSVKLSFDAIPSKAYNGITTHVSKVGIEEQEVVNYVVTVELTDADELVRPGMTAAINIIATQLENVLIVPNRAIRLLDDQRVVYILRNGTPQPVNIGLGASSDTYSEVISGDLQEGDLIVLNPPSQFASGGGFSMGR